MEDLSYDLWLASFQVINKKFESLVKIKPFSDWEVRERCTKKQLKVLIDPSIDLALSLHQISWKLLSCSLLFTAQIPTAVGSHFQTFANFALFAKSLILSLVRPPSLSSLLIYIMKLKTSSLAILVYKLMLVISSSNLIMRVILYYWVLLV